MRDWSDLDVFHAVVETGSLAGAARALGVSQPTVGRRLDALEKRLEGTLVVRGAGGVQLTPLGEAIHARVRSMADEAAAISRLAVGGDQALAGVVIVSTFEGIGDRAVPKLMAPFLSRHPDVELHLEVTTRRANLTQREADIGIRLDRGDQASLIARKVAQLGRGLYASKAYLDARGRPKSAGDLAAHDFVTYPEVGNGPRWVKDASGRHVPPKRIVLRSVSSGARLAAIEMGAGIGDNLHWRARGRPGLERVLPDLELKPWDLWLVTHEDVHRSARIRAVFDHLADSFAHNAARLLHGHPTEAETVDAAPARRAKSRRR